MSKITNPHIVTSIAVLSLSVACAGESVPDSPAQSEREIAQHQADLDFGLITQVEVASGHVVKFLQPSPGAVAISETFELNNRRPLNLGQPLYAIWEEIAGGQEMPDELAKLAEEQLTRLEEAAANTTSPAEVVTADVAGTNATAEPQHAIDEKHITSSGTHFDKDQLGCKTLGNDLKWKWCWLNRSGAFAEATKSAEAIATAVSVYSGTGLTLCTRMGNDNRCQDVRGGQGTFFIGSVGTNIFGVHVDQDLSAKLTLVVTGTNWHWGGSISGNYANAFTFGGYALNK